MCLGQSYFSQSLEKGCVLCFSALPGDLSLPHPRASSLIDIKLTTFLPRSPPRVSLEPLKEADSPSSWLMAEAPLSKLFPVAPSIPVLLASAASSWQSAGLEQILSSCPKDGGSGGGGEGREV